jgi:hypothetical protein
LLRFERVHPRLGEAQFLREDEDFAVWVCFDPIVEVAPMGAGEVDRSVEKLVLQHRHAQLQAQAAFETSLREQEVTAAGRAGDREVRGSGAQLLQDGADAPARRFGLGLGKTRLFPVRPVNHMPTEQDHLARFAAGLPLQPLLASGQHVDARLDTIEAEGEVAHEAQLLLRGIQCEPVAGDRGHVLVSLSNLVRIGGQQDEFRQRRPGPIIALVLGQGTFHSPADSVGHGLDVQTGVVATGQVLP